MPHTLPPLPYATNALEPHIDAQTMEIHHGKHHNAYVTNLNAALEKAPELADKPLEELLKNLNAAPESVRTAVRNNGGGHWNHSLFWVLMASASLPVGAPPAFGPIVCQNCEWLKCPPPLFRTAVRIASGTLFRSFNSSSSGLSASAGAFSSAALRLVT